MPRSRRQQATTQGSGNDETKENKKVANALTTEQIQKFLAGGRTKGAGEEVIKAFLAGGEAGEEVDLTNGPLAGKSPESAFATLNNAKKRTRQTEDGQTVLAMPDASSVRVIKRNLGNKDAPDVHVFLIDTAKVSV